MARLLKETPRVHKGLEDDTSSVPENTADNNDCQTVQCRLKDVQDSWLSSTAVEIQFFTDRKNTENFITKTRLFKYIENFTIKK